MSLTLTSLGSFSVMVVSISNHQITKLDYANEELRKKMAANYELVMKAFDTLKELDITRKYLSRVTDQLSAS